MVNTITEKISNSLKDSEYSEEKLFTVSKITERTLRMIREMRNITKILFALFSPIPSKIFHILVLKFFCIFITISGIFGKSQSTIMVNLEQNRS